MDSPALSKPPINRWLPIAAVFTDDLRQAITHWAILAWSALALLHIAFCFTAESSFSFPLGDGTRTASLVAGSVLAGHLMLWATFALAVGAGAIASESDVAAEAILCRGISRWQYYLGKGVGRSLTVITLFLLLAIPAMLLAGLGLESDLQPVGAVVALAMIGGILLAATWIGLAASVWFHNPLICFAVVWMGVYGLGITLSILHVDLLSPIALANAIPAILQGSLDFSPHLLSLLAATAITTAACSLFAYCHKDV